MGGSTLSISAAGKPLALPSPNLAVSGTYEIDVPYADEGLAWEDLVMAAAPGTRMFDPVQSAGKSIMRPRPPKDGRLRLLLVHYGTDVVSGPDSADYAERHGLYTANPYHMLALAQHVADMREAVGHILKRGPGLFATDPFEENDSWIQQSVGLWYPSPDMPCRATVMPYDEVLGELTYFLFARDHWLTD